MVNGVSAAFCGSRFLIAGQGLPAALKLCTDAVAGSVHVVGAEPERRNADESSS